MPSPVSLLQALKKLPGTTPAQLRVLRVSISAHTAAQQMRNGNRYRTRSLPRRTTPLPRFHSQPRDSQGRWCR